MPFIPDLASLVTAGYSVEDDGITYVVEPFDLGQVVLPTGEMSTILSLATSDRSATGSLADLARWASIAI